MQRFNKISAFIIIFTLVFSFTGCSMSKGPEQRKDIVVAARTMPSDLDPHSSTHLAAFMIEPLIYDRLVGMNKDGSIYGILAESWEQLDDTTIRFKLREGVRFQDGTELSPEDVVYSIARGEIGPGSRGILQYFDGANCKAVDQNTVDIKTYVPFAPALSYLASSRGCIISKAYAESAGDEALGRAPMGSGRFKLEEWKEDGTIVLTANPDYWGEKALAEKITISFIPDDAKRAQALIDGSCDLALNIPEESFGDIEDAEGLSLASNISFGGRYIALQSGKYEWLMDARLRKALAMALDREAIAAELYGGMAETMGSFYSSALPGWTHAFSYGYDPEEAARLLDEAGWDWERELELFTAPDGKAQMDEAAKYWEAVGIKCHVTVSPDSSRIYSDEGAPVYYLSSSPSFGDPELALIPYLDNRMGLAAAGAQELDRLLGEERSAFGIKDRTAKLGELQAALDEYCPVIPMASPVFFYGVSKELKGFVTDPGNVPDLSLLHW